MREGQGLVAARVCILNLAFCIAALWPPSASAQATPAPTEPVVVVSGEGLVHAVPDRAWITISAESRAASAREAQRRNTEAMTPVLSKLKAAGVPADAIRTVAYDVQYEWEFVEQQARGQGLPRAQLDRSAGRYRRSRRGVPRDSVASGRDRPGRHPVRPQGSREAGARGAASCRG